MKSFHLILAAALLSFILIICRAADAQIPYAFSMTVENGIKRTIDGALLVQGLTTVDVTLTIELDPGATAIIHSLDVHSLRVNLNIHGGGGGGSTLIVRDNRFSSARAINIVATNVSMVCRSDDLSAATIIVSGNVIVGQDILDVGAWAAPRPATQATIVNVGSAISISPVLICGSTYNGRVNVRVTGNRINASEAGGTYAAALLAKTKKDGENKDQDPGAFVAIRIFVPDDVDPGDLSSSVFKQQLASIASMIVEDNTIIAMWDNGWGMYNLQFFGACISGSPTNNADSQAVGALPRHLLPPAGRPPVTFSVSRNFFSMKTFDVTGIYVGPLGTLTTEMLTSFVSGSSSVSSPQQQQQQQQQFIFAENVMENITATRATIGINISALIPINASIIFVKNRIHVTSHDGGESSGAFPLSALAVGAYFRSVQDSGVGANLVGLWARTGYARSDLVVNATENFFSYRGYYNNRLDGSALLLISVKHLRSVVCTANVIDIFIDRLDKMRMYLLQLFYTRSIQDAITQGNTARVGSKMVLEDIHLRYVMIKALETGNVSLIASRNDNIDFVGELNAGGVVELTAGSLGTVEVSGLNLTTHNSFVRDALLVGNFYFDAEGNYKGRHPTVREIRVVDSTIRAAVPDGHPRGGAKGQVAPPGPSGVADHGFLLVKMMGNELVESLIVENVSLHLVKYHKAYMVTGRGYRSIIFKSNVFVFHLVWNAFLFSGEFDKDYNNGIAPLRLLRFENNKVTALAATAAQLLSITWGYWQTTDNSTELLPALMPPIFVGALPDLHLEFIRNDALLQTIGDASITVPGVNEPLPTIVAQVVATRWPYVLFDDSNVFNSNDGDVGRFIFAPESIIYGAIDLGHRCTKWNGQRVTKQLLLDTFDPNKLEVIEATLPVVGKVSITLKNTVVESIDGSCVQTSTRTHQRSISPTPVDTLTENSTGSHAPTRTFTRSGTKMILPEYGFSESEQTAQAALSALSSAAALFGPTVAFDAGVALSLLAIVQRCSQFSAAEKLVSSEGDKEALHRIYAVKYMSRSVSFPESIFGLTFPGNGPRNRVVSVRGAVVGGYLWLFMVVVCGGTALGFVGAKAANKDAALETLKKRWERRDAREQQQQQQQQQQRRGSLPKSDVAKINEQERREKEEQQLVVPWPTFAEASRFARYPYLFTLALAVQLSTWSANAASFLVAPAWMDDDVSIADRVMLGGMPLIGVWLLPAVLFAFYLHRWPLSRNYDLKSRLSKREQQQQQQTTCMSCFSPATRADTFQLERTVLWSKLDFDEDGNLKKQKQQQQKQQQQELAPTFKENLLVKLRDTSTCWNWMLVPEFCWSQGSTSRSVAMGGPGSFLRACGSLVNKYSGPHSQLLRRREEREEREEERGNNNNGEDSSSNSNTGSSLVTSVWRTRIGPFTVFLSSTLVVLAGVLQATAALCPTACVPALVALSIFQAAAFLFWAVVRPFLLRPVNAIVAASALFMVISCIVAAAILAEGEGKKTAVDPQFAAKTEAALAAVKAMLQTAVGLALCKGAVGAAAKGVSIALGLYTASTEAQLLVLNAAERQRLLDIKRQQREHDASVDDISAAVDEIMMTTPTNSNNTNKKKSVADDDDNFEMALLSPTHRAIKPTTAMTTTPILTATRHTKSFGFDFLKKSPLPPPQLHHRQQLQPHHSHRRNDDDAGVDLLFPPPRRSHHLHHDQRQLRLHSPGGNNNLRGASYSSFNVAAASPPAAAAAAAGSSRNFFQPKSNSGSFSLRRENTAHTL